MQYIPFVTEEILHAQADYADSRGLLPELVLRLITASVRHPKDLRFPIRGSTGQRGPDGILDSPTDFEPYIPEGLSFWECGTGANPSKKATEDFDSRTLNTPSDVRAQSRFIFVTPRSASHTWNVDDQKDWIEEREDKGWRKISIIDATLLSQWLRHFPAIDLWLAQEFRLLSGNFSTPVLHWETLKSYGAPPDLQPGVFLVGRTLAIEQARSLFEGNTKELLLRSRYPIEVTDFVAACLMSLPEEDQYSLTGRCIFIRDEMTWKALCTLREPHVFVADERLDVIGSNADLRQQAKSRGHSVILGGIIAGHGNAIDLYEAKPFELAQQLEVCGYGAERARQVSEKCGGRIPVLKRLLQDCSASPDWANPGDASALRCAALIGQWDGGNEGDRRAIETLLGNAYGEWIGTIRPLSLRPDPPLVQINEKWRFVSRYEGWQVLAPHLSDDDLSRFHTAAVQVLSEIDPTLSLTDEERLLSPVRGIRWQYSHRIRTGLSETLALLGSYPGSLTGCSAGKGDQEARKLVAELLEDASWELWASLKDVMPALAEAAPNEFLGCIEKGLAKDKDSPFRRMFELETPGAFGKTYMTGLLWALETLAWSPDHLNRVTIILGQLTEQDPGGNWGNRPFNSLVSIYLPWFPQTCASGEKRKAALRILNREIPSVAWRLLLELLPSGPQSTSGTVKPSWRRFIPPDHPQNPLQSQYLEQVRYIGEVIVEIATADTSKFSALIEVFPGLPGSAKDSVMAYLSSEAMRGLAEPIRSPLWEALEHLIRRHRRFSTANWAMSSDIVDQLQAIADGLQPKAPRNLYRRLFCERNLDLFEGDAEWSDKLQAIEARRDAAILEVLEVDGLTGVLSFARDVTSPWNVGYALGRVSPDELDKQILPQFLESQEKPLAQLAANFALARFRLRGLQWIHSLGYLSWTQSQQAKLFVSLPFQRESWLLVDNLKSEAQAEYWRSVSAMPSEEELEEAVTRLIDHGRPFAALDCIDRLIHISKPPTASIAIRALKSAITSDEPATAMDPYHAVEILKWLQNQTDVTDEERFPLEWAYLRIYDSHSAEAPKTLVRRLSSDATFFSELISLIFVPEGMEANAEKASEENKRVAENSYHLLRLWKTPPGCSEDGVVDSLALANWISTVKDICGRSGHLRIAMDQIGKVMAHAQGDPEGFWIHKAYAELLNAQDAEIMRNAFTCELFNMRAVHSWTAGAEEKELAEKFYRWARDADDQGFQRLASAVRELGDSYMRDAEREKIPYWER